LRARGEIFKPSSSNFFFLAPIYSGKSRHLEVYYNALGELLTLAVSSGASPRGVFPSENIEFKLSPFPNGSSA